MNKILQEIIFLFVVIIFSNILVDYALGGDQPLIFMDKPFLFFGISIIMSIIGGSFIYWVKNRQRQDKN